MREYGLGLGQVEGDAGDAGARDREGEASEGGALEGEGRGDAVDWFLLSLPRSHLGDYGKLSIRVSEYWAD